MAVLGEANPLSDSGLPVSDGTGITIAGGDTPPYSANISDTSGYRVTLTDDLIIDIAGGVSAAAIAAAMQAVGASVIEGAGQGLQLWSISGDAEAAAASLASLGIATSIERNAIIEDSVSSVGLINVSLPSGGIGISAVIPNDPFYSSLYGMDRISAPEAWARNTGSSSVVVGIIDTGIDIDHPDLINNIWVNTDEIWGDGIDNDNNGYIDDYNGYDFVRNAGIGPGYAYDDEHGHGTHVSGTVAAEGNNGIGVAGVAWDAELMAAKFLDADGSGSTFDAIRAVRYTTANGAQVTNNSWGGGGFSSGLYTAIDEARQAGNLFVAAAGNSNQNTDSFAHYPSTYNLDNIISVASTTSTDARSSFSNYGALSVDLAAPGSSILSTMIGGGYASWSGTSMATPHVTGAIALMLSVNPSLTYAEIRDALFASVDPVSSMNGITATGGRLNVAAALALVDATPLTDITLPDSIVEENAPGAVVGALAGIGGVGAVTYSITSDPSGIFELRDGTNLALRSGVSLNHESGLTYSVTVQGIDSNGNSATGNFTVSVGDVNEAPTAIAGPASPAVSEAATIGTALGTYTVAGDPDSGDTASYSMVNNANGQFAIDSATGVLTVAGALDFESGPTPSVIVRATDSGGLFVDRTIAVSVTNVDEAPIVAGQNLILAPGAVANWQVNATDPEGGSVTYQLAQGPANGSVSLAVDGSYSYTPNIGYLGADSFSITAADGQGNLSTAAMTVTVKNPEAAGALLDPVTGSLTPEQTSGGMSAMEDVQAAALAGGGYVLVWNQRLPIGDPFLIDYFFQRFDDFGNKIGEKSRLRAGAANIGNPIIPKVTALPDGGFIVAYHRNSAMRFDAGGNAVTPEVELSVEPGGNSAGHALISDTMLLQNGKLFVLNGGMHDAPSHWNPFWGNGFVSASIIDPDNMTAAVPAITVGNPTIGPIRHSQATQLTDGTIIVAWTEAVATEHSQTNDSGFLKFRRLNRDGTLLGPEISISRMTNPNRDDTEYMDVAALSDGGYVVTWTTAESGDTHNGLYFRKYAANGTPLTGNQQIHSSVFGAQRRPTILALDDGGFIATYASDTPAGGTNSYQRIFVRQFNAIGLPVGDEKLVFDGTTLANEDVTSVIRLNNGNILFAVVSSTGVYFWGDDFQINARILSGGGSNTELLGTSGDDVMFSSPAGETLNGLAGNDTLIGASGDDTLNGGSGDDTYRFGVGGGTDTIIDTGGSDVIELGAGITVADIAFEISGGDLLIGISEVGASLGAGISTLDIVRITGWSAGNSPVETLRFDDGTELNLSDVVVSGGTVNISGNWGGALDRRLVR